MAVDEFGREIQGSSGGSSSHAPFSASRRSLELDSPLTASRRRDPPTSSSSGNNGGNGGGSSPQHHRSQQPPRRSLPSHPCFSYTESPLQCQFVWKDSEDGAAAVAAASNGNNNDEVNNISGDATNTTTSMTATDEAYQVYRQRYCLNYIHSFFNKHLDDTWFRQRYSPAAKLAARTIEHDLARAEAAAFVREAQRANNDDSTIADSTAAFWSTVRLGHGSKSVSASVPSAHLPSWISRALTVTQVPPHVTDEQLRTALTEATALAQPTAASGSSSSKNRSKLSFTMLPTNVLSRNTSTSLYRQVVVLLDEDTANAAVPDNKNSSTLSPTDIVKALLHMSGVVVPRKSETSLVAPLLVTCSDPYNRAHFDANGRGGLPPDGRDAVMVRTTEVQVSTLSDAMNNNSNANSSNNSSNAMSSTVTLSAAVSVSSRHSLDLERARAMARALDQQAGIGSDNDADTTVRGSMDALAVAAAATDTADALDVCVAYLRRVHGISYYDGATSLVEYQGQRPCAADALAAPVLLRLSDADEILPDEATATDKKTNSSDDAALGTGGVDESPKDLFVQRLDDRLTEAMEALSKNDDTTGTSDLQTKAAAILEAEAQVKETWLQNHAMIDSDGRARCSFHFCHKLFKDTVFLNKHLLKKHAEFLHAEEAKCHDEHMMAAWDALEDRPVPDILVDCGAIVGIRPVPVRGKIPDVVDPEPALWKEVQEQNEKQQQLQQQMHARRQEVRHAPSGPRPAAFVDVDDMKEEKMELSFENVVVAEPIKKKKKKRKLL